MKTLTNRLQQAADVAKRLAKLDTEMRVIVLRDANETYNPGLVARPTTPFTRGKRRAAKVAVKRGPGRPKGSKNKAKGR